MKTRYYIFGAALCSMMGLGLTSCNNDKFLDVQQYNIVDVEAEYNSDANARLSLNGIYAYNNISKQDDSWGYKPNLFTGGHPTLDTQCTGWDVMFCNQTWTADKAELGQGWAHCYAAICRANEYLAGLENADKLTANAKRFCEGEARALRGYFYSWLATTFGRVPMLNTGEDFNNTPNKAAAETYEEMWDFIIADFQAASELLEWAPYNGEYGRCTKGMAKAYLADAYMWKAYRCPDQAADCYAKAKAELKSIIDSGTYELSTNFATNWDPAGFWNKECIWAMCSDEGNEWSSWGGDRTITWGANPNMFKWFTACPENGGWGAEFLSWEWYDCYEPGDTRRDASCATGHVPADQMAKYGIEPSKVVYGFNPYLKDSVGSKWDVKPDNVNYGRVLHPYKNAEGIEMGTKTEQFHFLGNGEYAPSIWTTKWWRNAYADGNSWGTQMWCPTIVYGKRYANVLLDYAECCFRTGQDEEGWKQLDILRNRAWGNLTVGQDYSKYFGHFNNVYNAYPWQGDQEHPHAKPHMDKYPVGVLTSTVSVPSAKEYYTLLQAMPNRVGYTHTSEAWKVAVNEERRKEFNSEWCLCPDMIKSGYIEDHINYNYPKDNGGSDYANYPWTKREFEFDPNKMDMPIPADELLKNTLLKQNPGY